MKKQKSKYKSLKEWRTISPNAYRAALRRGMIKEICDTFGWEYKVKKAKVKH